MNKREIYGNGKTITIMMDDSSTATLRAGDGRASGFVHYNVKPKEREPNSADCSTYVRNKSYFIKVCR